MTKTTDLLFIGIGGHVLALDPTTGEEVWRRKLQAHSFQTILRRGDRIFAGVGGELWCLDAATGEILWANKLKGLGMGLISFSGESDIALEDWEQTQAAASVSS